MNHAVSGLKFKILQRFLNLGYAVLLSDVDIIVLRNPFDHLFKDSDVESMSDGWNNQTAYGMLLITPPPPPKPSGCAMLQSPLPLQCSYLRVPSTTPYAIAETKRLPRGGFSGCPHPLRRISRVDAGSQRDGGVDCLQLESL